MLVHPLTDTRRPALTQTSARADPEGWVTANNSGTAVKANTAITIAADGRFHEIIVLSWESENSATADTTAPGTSSPPFALRDRRSPGRPRRPGWPDCGSAHLGRD